jgi:hypothetical protein
MALPVPWHQAPSPTPDFRLSRVFGLGPFVGFPLGQYSRYHIEGITNVTQEGDIAEKALHEWFTIGLRTVFFP